MSATQTTVTQKRRQNWRGPTIWFTPDMIALIARRTRWPDMVQWLRARPRTWRQLRAYNETYSTWCLQVGIPGIADSLRHDIEMLTSYERKVLLETHPEIPMDGVLMTPHDRDDVVFARANGFPRSVCTSTWKNLFERDPLFFRLTNEPYPPIPWTEMADRSEHGLLHILEIRNGSDLVDFPSMGRVPRAVVLAAMQRREAVSFGEMRELCDILASVNELTAMWVLQTRRRVREYGRIFDKLRLWALACDIDVDAEWRRQQVEEAKITMADARRRLAMADEAVGAAVAAAERLTAAVAAISPAVVGRDSAVSAR